MLSFRIMDALLVFVRCGASVHLFADTVPSKNPAFLGAENITSVGTTAPLATAMLVINKHETDSARKDTGRHQLTHVDIITLIFRRIPSTLKTMPYLIVGLGQALNMLIVW